MNKHLWLVEAHGFKAVVRATTVTDAVAASGTDKKILEVTFLDANAIQIPHELGFSDCVISIGERYDPSRS